MAELVHRRTEEMLSELEQLQRVNLFTAKEIKAVIKKRTNHEYKLVRRTKDKDDFLSYIHYEINLLDLIHKRRMREQYFFKKDEIEFAIVSRIHRLFKQMTFRWAHNLKLWMQHANFCIKWNKKIQLSKLCTKFLQIHGNKPKMWILASKWEIECGNSMEKGRALFMKAVKLHPQDRNLWLEFFRAELLFAEKLRKRLKLLTASDVDIDDLDASESCLMNGDAARIVYNNAILTISDDVNFHTKFLRIILIFLGISPFAAGVLKGIEDNLWKDHSTDPIARSSLAQLHLHRSYGGLPYKSSNGAFQQQQHDLKCYEAFDEAVCEINTTEMWGEYVDCMLTLCEECRNISEVVGEPRATLFQSRLNHAIDIMFKAHESGKLSDCQYLKIVDFLLKQGLLGKANEILYECCQNHPVPQLLIKRIKVLLLVSMEDNNASLGINELFEECSLCVGELLLDHQCSFWEMWMEYAILQSDEELARCIATEHSVGISSQAADPMINLYLKWIAVRKGAKAAFQIFQEISHHRTPSLKRFKNILDLLQSSCEATLINECFEAILREYGSSDSDLWLEYIKYVKRYENSSKVGEIHWRALKMLQPKLVDQFITGYAMLDFNQNQPL